VLSEKIGRKKTLFVLGTILLLLGIANYTMAVEAPVGERVDPYQGYRFLVEIDGIVSTGFTEVIGLNITTDVIEYREGNNPEASYALIPGLNHYGPIILRRGLTSNMELWNWMEKTLDGDVERKNMAIVITGPTGSQVARFEMWGCWPSGYRILNLKAGWSVIIIEELTIQVEGIDRT